MNPQRWRRRQPEVDAMFVSHDNCDQVAVWAGGRADTDPQTERPFIRLPNSAIPALPGDYVVRDVMPDGLGPARPMKAIVFEWAFEKTAGAGLRHRARNNPD